MADFFNPDKEVEKTAHNLPHWQQGETWTFVTFRLADSLPANKLKHWQSERQRWLEQHPEPWNEKTETTYHELFSHRIDQWLDRGHGACLLRNPENSLIVAQAFEYFSGRRYRLARYVIMPNHVHVLFQPREEFQLAAIIHSWKRFSSREINRREQREGPFWQADYWDRLIRSPKHFHWTLNYIEDNSSKLPKSSYRLGPD